MLFLRVTIFLVVFWSIPTLLGENKASLSVESGHWNGITSLAFHPNGRILASASFDKTIKLWDVKTGAPLRTLYGHSKTILSVDFNGDGSLLASGSTDGRVILWDINAVGVKRVFENQKDSNNWVCSVSLCKSNNLLAIGQKNGDITVYNTETDKVIYEVCAHADKVRAVQFSRDGTLLASASDDLTIKIRSALEGQEKEVLKGHKDKVSSIAFHPNNNYLASAAEDRSLIIWDLRVGEKKSLLKKHDHILFAVDFSSDARHIATGSEDRNAIIWDFPSGKSSEPLVGHDQGIRAVKFSPDGTLLATAGYDRMIKIWNVAKQEIETEIDAGFKMTSIAINPEREILAVAKEDNTVKLWDLKNCERRLLNSYSKGDLYLAFSPDGTTLASTSIQNNINLSSVESGETLRTLIGHTAEVGKLAFSPDGKILASTSKDLTLRLWDTETGQLREVIRKHEQWTPQLADFDPKEHPTATATAFSPDGRYLAYSLIGKKVHVVVNENKTWSEINTPYFSYESLRSTEFPLEGHENVIFSLNFSHDSKLMASVGNDNLLMVWNLEDRSLKHKFRNNFGPFYSVSFSPDNQFLAAAGTFKSIKTWKIRPEIEEPNELQQNFYDIVGLDFTSDGSQLIFGCAGGKLGICDANSLALQGVFTSLVNDEWIAYHPKKLVYNSSMKGDECVAIRFDNQLYAPYPLKYFRKILKRKNGLFEAFLDLQPQIKPQPIRLYIDNIHNKNIWIVSGVAILLLLGLLVAFVWIKRTRLLSLQTTKDFFGEIEGNEVVMISQSVLKIIVRGKKYWNFAFLWEGEVNLFGEIDSVIGKNREYVSDSTNFYIIYRKESPKSEIIEKIRKLILSKELRCEVVPLFSVSLRKALTTEDDCNRILKELQEPYLRFRDPYAIFTPIRDPVWFYGRKIVLSDIRRKLVQGHHIGVFGLRKVGKTSLINILNQGFINTPVIHIDCQARFPDAIEYFKDILNRLDRQLKLAKIKKVPRIPVRVDDKTFSSAFSQILQVTEHFKEWEHIIFIWDEMDRFFPEGNNEDSDLRLREYEKLFSILRGLGEPNGRIVNVVVAYRPDINRRDRIGPRRLDNPMYKSFQECFLSFFSRQESNEMIRGIGQWKDISWYEDALNRVYHYCSGHPVVTRLFASASCDEGRRKSITLEMVEETAQKICDTFRKNEIGNYYSQGIWSRLTKNEKSLILTIEEREGNGFFLKELASEFNEDYQNLSNFGLIREEKQKLFITAQLFKSWLQEQGNNHE